MNPFFWLLVLAGAVGLWFALRKLFIGIGARASGLVDETAEILGSDEKSKENDGGNKNA